MVWLFSKQQKRNKAILTTIIVQWNVAGLWKLPFAVCVGSCFRREGARVRGVIERAREWRFSQQDIASSPHVGTRYYPVPWTTRCLKTKVLWHSSGKHVHVILICSLAPHFYKVILGYTGVCIIFLIFALNHRLMVLDR